MNIKSEKLSEMIAKAASDKKARDIVIMYMKDIS